MQKQTWETKAGFLACCGVSKQNVLVLASFPMVSPNQLSARSRALVLWLCWEELGLWRSHDVKNRAGLGFGESSSSNQLAKRSRASEPEPGLGLGLWLKDLLRWLNSAAWSYML